MATTALSTILKLDTPELEDHVVSCNAELDKRKKAQGEEKEQILEDLKMNSAFLEDARLQRTTSKKKLKELESSKDANASVLENLKTQVREDEETVRDAKAKHQELQDRLEEIEKETIEEYEELPPAIEKKPETAAQKRKREKQEKIDAMDDEERAAHYRKEADDKAKAKNDRDERKRKADEYDELEAERDELKQRKKTLKSDVNYFKEKDQKSTEALQALQNQIEKFLAEQEEPEMLLAKFSDWQAKRAATDDEELMD
jgi:chromosome segregation ATPase